MNIITMFGKYLEYARRIRHVLDAWLLLILCLAIAPIPWIGLPLGALCVLSGMIASLRVMKEGRLRHGLILGGLFALILLLLPFIRMAAREKSRMAESSSFPSAIQSSMAHSIQPEFSFQESTPLPELPQLQEVPIAPLTLQRAPEQFSPNVAETEPEPEPLTSTPTVKNRTRESVDTVCSWWDAKQSGNVVKALELHADPVDLEGTFFSKEEFRAHLEKDWKQNADVRENLIGLHEVFETPDQITVRSQMRFGIPPDGNGFSIRGQCLHSFVLRDMEGQMRIVGHSEAILPEIRASKKINGMTSELLRKVLSCCLEADVAGDTGTSMCFYAPNVLYFGTKQTSAEIHADKLRYFERWPGRNECFEGEFTLNAKSNKRTEAFFKSRFRTESRERGEWCEGFVEHHFVFEQMGKHPLIVEQSARIIESRKGTL